MRDDRLAVTLLQPRIELNRRGEVVHSALQITRVQLFVTQQNEDILSII